jgi:hypothetical protein
LSIQSTAALVNSSSINRLHALDGQRSGIFDPLLANLAVLWVDGRIVCFCRPAMQDTARPEPLAEARVLWIVGSMLGV